MNVVSRFSRTVMSYVVSAGEEMRRLTAELAEHAEKYWEFFSAGCAVFAFNVIGSHALKADTTYVQRHHAV
jgi:hypothetical protein